jgi:hypothetical protein
MATTLRLTDRSGPAGPATDTGQPDEAERRMRRALGLLPADQQQSLIGMPVLPSRRGAIGLRL